jgi:hypothetical protein
MEVLQEQAGGVAEKDEEQGEEEEGPAGAETFGAQDDGLEG